MEEIIEMLDRYEVECVENNPELEELLEYEL